MLIFCRFILRMQDIMPFNLAYNRQTMNGMPIILSCYGAAVDNLLLLTGCDFGLSLIHISILPVMGVTLPFFSAGGSSAACLYLGFGLVQSVYMRRKESDGMRLKRKQPLRFGYKQMKDI